MPTPTPFFSVVVPTYNRGALLPETIASLAAQDIAPEEFEIIVIDDGSTEDPTPHLQPYLDRIRLVRQQNSGVATARNAGTRLAAGEYIVSLDDDDLLSPDALRIYQATLRAFALPPLLIATPAWFRGERRPDFRRSSSLRIECLSCRDYFAKSFPLYTSNSVMIVRRELAIGVGGYEVDSEGLDDDIFLFKLGTAGPLVHIAGPRTVGHRMHEANGRRRLEWITRGYEAHIRKERRGLYPGGPRRMLDRRGIIGKGLLSSFRNLYWQANYVSLGERLRHIGRLLVNARGMVPAAFVRKACSYFYAREQRSLDLPALAAGAESPGHGGGAPASAPGQPDDPRRT